MSSPSKFRHGTVDKISYIDYVSKDQTEHQKLKKTLFNFFSNAAETERRQQREDGENGKKVEREIKRK